VAAVAPDGSVALLPDADGELLRVRLKDAVVSSTGLKAARGPASWSRARDGFVVAATRMTDDTSGTWTVPVAGPVTLGPSAVAWASVSAGGAVVGLSGGDQPRLEFRPSWLATPSSLTGSSRVIETQPTFSPGGDVVLFVRAAPNDAQRSSGIWSVGVDGAGLRQLSPDGSDPRWLP
jgi:hypothetical protein